MQQLSSIFYSTFLRLIDVNDAVRFAIHALGIFMLILDLILFLKS